MSKIMRYIIVFLGLNVLIIPAFGFCLVMIDMSVVGDTTVTLDTIKHYLPMSISSSIIISLVSTCLLFYLQKKPAQIQEQKQKK